MGQPRDASVRRGVQAWLKVIAVVAALEGLGCYAPVHAQIESCEDRIDECPRLASLGHCLTRRQFMLVNCPASCDDCVDPTCFDRTRSCPLMAQGGLCETQKILMTTLCPISCGACVAGPATAIGFTDVRTIINPDFECGKPLPEQGRRKRQIIFPDEEKYLTYFSLIFKDQPPALHRQRPQTQQFDKLVEQPTPSPGPAELNVEDTFCGATPITDRLLITAAHCAVNEKRPLTSVRLGELDFSRDDENNSRIDDYAIESIIIHPDFNPANLNRYNDIALLLTKEKMKFHELVYPFCLSDEAPVPGTVVTGSGFGISNVTHRPTHLQEAELEIIDSTECEEIFRKEQSIPHLRLRYPNLLQGQSILCASFPERSACRGDSGGPIFIDENGRRFMVGLVGSGASCRNNGVSILPGLFIKLADHIGFIESVYSNLPV